MIVLNSPAARGVPSHSSRRVRPAMGPQAVVTMIAFASLSVACTGNSRDESHRSGNTSEPASVVGKEGTPNTPQRAPDQDAAASQATGEVPQQLLALFRDDLARRALVKPETITVVSATEQQWPDGALGCPKPGQMYAQMIVPGYRVMLQAAGERYAYHSDQRGNFVVCANGLALPPAK